MSRHEADQNAATTIREHQAAQQAGFGITYEGFGKHRATEVKA